MRSTRNKLIDLSGKTFTRLTVTERAYLSYTKQASWRCVCACGQIRVYTGQALRNNLVKSCGCYRLEILTKNKLHPAEYKRRRAQKSKEASKTPKRRKQKIKAQLKYRISDKAALAQFRRWVKKQKKVVNLTDEDLLALRNQPCHKCGKDIPRTGVCFTIINPKVTIDPGNVLPTCGICKLIKPKERFNAIDFAKKTLRRYWKQTPMASIAKQKARKAVGKYECAGCKGLFSDKMMDLDHILPVVDPQLGFIDLETWTKRLYCDESNLQYLCKVCHSSKTREENAARQKYKKEKRK